VADEKGSFKYPLKKHVKMNVLSAYGQGVRSNNKKSQPKYESSVLTFLTLCFFGGFSDGPKTNL